MFFKNNGGGELQVEAIFRHLINTEFCHYLLYLFINLKLCIKILRENRLIAYNSLHVSYLLV